LTETVAALDKASNAHKTIAQKVALLDEAAQKLEQAKALGDDPDIQNSIAATRAKIEALKPQVTAAEQAVVAATAARDGAAGVKEAQLGQWKAVVDRLVPIEEQLRQADVAMTQAREAFQSARRASAMLSQRAQRMEQVAAWFDRSSEVIGYQSQISQLAAEMTPMQEMLIASNKEKVDVEQALVSMQGAIDQSNKQLEPIVGKWKELVAQKEKLVATKTQLAESKSLLADPTAIDAAIAQFDASLTAKDAQLGTVDTQMKQMQATLVEMQKKIDESKAILVSTTSKVQAAQVAIDAHRVSIQTVEAKMAKLAEECGSLKDQIDENCQATFALAPERALSPEQFGWSILTATNVHANTIANERAELDKNSPLAANLPAEQLASEQRVRLLRIVRAARDKLQGTIDTFSSRYASGVGQTSDDFFASPDQALFVANGGSIYGWAAPSGANLTQLAIQAPDPQAATELLTRGLLARSAQTTELQWIPEMISKSPETKSAVIHELVWGILAGVEFRLYP
jgi:chromosome segregation ATPase